MPTKNGKQINNTHADTNHQKISCAVVKCACNNDITIEELLEVYPNRGKNTLEKFLGSLNLAMNRYDIHSCLRKAHFLAQVGHESSELRYTSEVLDKGVTEEKAYGGYKGRGLIQLTGFDNYSRYGEYVNQDLLGDNKKKIEEPKLASDSAGWFWKIGRGEDLNVYADKNDILYISASINGGFNGYEGGTTSRLNLLKNAANALSVRACPQLEALFSAFPEVEKFNYDSFPIEKSKAYEIPDMVFAWGYWHDPDVKKRHGTKKDIVQAKIGYARYLELIAKKPPKKDRGRFGFKKRVEMKIHAEAKLR
jgi:predicted chitinase